MIIVPIVSSGKTNPMPLDKKRLESMYRAHHVIIWRTLRRIGHSPEAAADFTQQAYLIAAERLSDVRPGCEKAFLFSTAIRLGKTSLRRERRMDLPGDLPEMVEHSQSALPLVDRQQALQLLERILCHMDEDLVTVFSLFELEGLSSPEVAQILEIPVGTVASRLRRARQTFRSAAERLEQGGGASLSSPPPNPRPNEGSQP